MCPFKVQEKVGKLAYQLLLPPHMNIHIVISATQLSPAQAPGSDPCGRGPPLLDTLDTVEDEAEGLESFEYYKVERIIQRRDRRVGRGPAVAEYLIKWADYPYHHNV